MSNAIDRRRFLNWVLGTASAAATMKVGPVQAASKAATTYACQFSKPSDALSKLLASTPIIDVHCHIFNATDIPAYQFMEQVVGLKEAFDNFNKQNGTKSIYQINKSQVDAIYADAKTEFSELLKLIREHEWIAGSVLEGGSSYPLDRLLLTPSYWQEMALLDDVKGPQGLTLGGVPLRLMRTVANKCKQSKGNTLYSNYMREWVLYTPGDWKGTKKLTDTQVRQAAERMSIQNEKFNANSALLKYQLRFITPMCQTRTENFLRLRDQFKVYGAAKSGITRLFTPALVDFEYWLDGPQTPKAAANKPSLIEAKGQDVKRIGANLVHVKREPTTIKQQVEMMGMIARKFPGECHSFFGFCPWRQAHANHLEKTTDQPQYESPLRLLKSAIVKDGFVGVKLYPPMGFRPRNNKLVETRADKTLRDQIKYHMFPKHLYQPGRFKYADAKKPGESLNDWKIRQSTAFGELLDEALDQLFSFCIEYNVPIMAHAAPSNFSGGYDFFEKETDTLKYQFYAEKASIEYWLRVVEQPEYAGLRLNLAHSGFHNAKWTEWLEKILTQSPNTYADLSYFENILSGYTSKTACKSGRKDAEGIRAMLEANPKLWQRFMFGSDWYMMARERHSENYLDVFVRLLSDVTLRGIDKNVDGERQRRFKAVMAGNAARFLGLDLKDEKHSNYKRLLAFYENTLKPGSAELITARENLNRYAALAKATAAA